jgi:sensor histidine kinase regulating citrate/malate metabolism
LIFLLWTSNRIVTPIAISDVELDHGFKPNVEIARSQGFRAVKATPIFDHGGRKLGVVSVHFTEPKWDWNFKRSESVLSKIAEATLSRNFAVQKKNIY